MSVAQTVDRDKPVRAHWTPEQVETFIELWNTRHPLYAADHFGIKRSYAYAMASMLRRAGRDLVRYNGRNPVMLPADSRALLDLLCDGLAAHYSTTQAAILGKSHKHDGRMQARHALAWAGRHLLHLTLKQVGIYLGCPHSSVIYMSRRASEPGKRACADILDRLKARSA
jgi:hypothetical protein